MTEKPKAAPAEEYVLKTCAPADLTDAEIKVCVALVSEGGAVPRGLSRRAYVTRGFWPWCGRALWLSPLAPSSASDMTTRRVA
jgi:hypothetical protein